MDTKDTAAAGSHEDQMKALQLRKLAAEVAKLEAEANRAEITAAAAAASDFENGVLTLWGAVDEQWVKTAVRDLNELARHHPGESLVIKLNTPGGSVLEGLALYDEIRAIAAQGHYITIKVRGRAASMGAILLQAADWRVIGEEANVLIHALSGQVAGEVNHEVDGVTEHRRLWAQLAAILANRSTMTDKQIMRKAYKRDWVLTAKEAKENGFADEIA